MNNDINDSRPISPIESLDDEISKEEMKLHEQEQLQQHRYITRKRTGRFSTNRAPNSDASENVMLDDEELDFDNGPATTNSSSQYNNTLGGVEDDCNGEESEYKKIRVMAEMDIPPLPDNPKISVSDFIPQENTGTIHVGAKHQAVIPTLERNQKPQKRPIDCTWIPGRLSDDEVDDYLIKVTVILRDYIEQQQMTNCLLPVPASPIFLNEDLEEVTPPLITTKNPYPFLRECSETKILSALHSCKYDVNAALHSIKSAPSSYLNALWAKPDQRAFHSAFRQYCGALRLIQKQNTTKTHKEIIDYFYRFKIPDQFRKFQEKKREQAMGTMERVLKKSNPSQDSSPKHTRYATEERRLIARELLTQVRETMGEDKYQELGGLIKMYHNTRGSFTSDKDALKSLKSKALDLLEGNEQLFSKFLQFLPSNYR